MGKLGIDKRQEGVANCNTYYSLLHLLLKLCYIGYSRFFTRFLACVISHTSAAILTVALYPLSQFPVSGFKLQLASATVLVEQACLLKLIDWLVNRL
jgi:hypothetical protein